MVVHDNDMKENLDSWKDTSGYVLGESPAFFI